MSILAIDAGTTGVRALVFNADGQMVSGSYREFPQHFPRPGWIEHDLDQIWESIEVVIAEAIAELDANEIAAVGITNQRETACAWSRSDGRPRARAIVWQDRRTAERCDELRRDGLEPVVREKTGLVLDPYFTATKFEWILREGAVVADADLALGTIDSWVLYKLTGGRVHATDWSNASRTMLLDLDTQTWDPSLCDVFNVPMSALPELRPSSYVYGVTDPACAAGLSVPVSGIAGDQQAALFGQACIEPGMSKNTYGTGSFVLLNTGDTRPPTVEGLLTTIAWGIDGGGPVFAYEGAIFSTGSAIQWLRDGLEVIADASEAGPLAESVDDTGGVYFVPAFAGLGSPWWDPYARGALFGLTRGTGRAEVVRAVVESMAYQTRDVVEAMENSAKIEVSEVRVDGGAAVMDFLCQFQADQLGVKVRRAKVSETTALGAAYLAGLAVGTWSSTDSIIENWSEGRCFSPAGDRDLADRRYTKWKAAVERSLAWAEEDT
ncbi:MAG: glycerol kinase [Acidobacteria bacterium]|nr:MAG: glycerol kinase [Acidobacteriota bacterium]